MEKMENMEFKRVAFGGYSAKQVDETVARLMRDIGKKDEQIAEYGAKFKELYEKIENMENQQVAERALVADMIISARQEAETIRGTARLDAETIIGEAHQEAETMVGTARNEADGIASDAKNNAESILSEAQRESEQIKTKTKHEAGAIRRQILNEYAQFETDMNGIAESYRFAKEQLRTMFDSSETRIVQVMNNVRQMLPEADDSADLQADIETVDVEVL